MRKRILIIDDDKTILEAIRILLEEEGFFVSTLNDGNNLKKKMANCCYDLFLIDYRLPGKDGWEITKTLRKQKHTRSVPIIMISADNNVKKIASKSVDAFLAKPFDINILLTTIQKCIK